MPTQLQQEASRINGAKSHGPITPAGKRISSQNAITHGMCADLVVMKNESRDSFLEVLGQLNDRFRPADEVEYNIVEEMAASYWRQRRSWNIETHLFDAQTTLQPKGGIPAAFAHLAVGRALDLLYRYETRSSLTFQRSLRTFLLLREKVPIPNEPSPAPEPEPQPIPKAPDSEPLVGQPILAAAGFQPALRTAPTAPEEPSVSPPAASPNVNQPGGAL